LTSLVFFRDELRTRLRRPGADGLPFLAEAREMLSAYLTAERAQGRIAADANVDSLALSLIGASHLLFAGRQRHTLPDPAELEKLIDTLIADAIQRRLL
jgi:hypothetical protein